MHRVGSHSGQLQKAGSRSQPNSRGLLSECVNETKLALRRSGHKGTTQKQEVTSERGSGIPESITGGFRLRRIGVTFPPLCRSGVGKPNITHLSAAHWWIISRATSGCSKTGYGLGGRAEAIVRTQCVIHSSVTVYSLNNHRWVFKATYALAKNPRSKSMHEYAHNRSLHACY